MKTLAPSSDCRRQRGSALVTVIIFSCVLLALVASVMQWSLTERRLNSRNASWLEARNAAEAAAETQVVVPGKGPRGSRPKKPKGPLWTKRG